MEIERKFLPDLTNLPFDPADYPVGRSNRDICTAPVVRVRKDNDSYILTYKSKGLMVREEFNLPLTEEGYRHLIAKADGRVIRKKDM